VCKHGKHCNVVRRCAPAAGLATLAPASCCSGDPLELKVGEWPPSSDRDRDCQTARLLGRWGLPTLSAWETTGSAPAGAPRWGLSLQACLTLGGGEVPDTGQTRTRTTSISLIHSLVSHSLPMDGLLLFPHWHLLKFASVSSLSSPPTRTTYLPPPFFWFE
jgi:hypothetical protein